MSFKHVKAGDIVFRLLAGTIEMPLVVTEVTKDRVICDTYEFDLETGVEEDHDIGWGRKFGFTGSYLKSEISPS